MSTAGATQTLGQPQSSARAAVALAARGRLIPVCRAPCRQGGGQRPPCAPVPAVRSLPPGGSPCPVASSSKHCASAHPAATPDPKSDPVPGPRGAQTVCVRRRSLHPQLGSGSGPPVAIAPSLSRNCHADRPLAGVHRGLPAHGVPRKVTQTQELRRPPRSIPRGTGLWPARCRRPWKLL